MKENALTEGDFDVMREIRDALESERLLTARVADSILRLGQLASVATPEMQDMFHQWLGLIGGQVIREAGEKGECDISSVARSIGIGETTLFSLLVSLHRAGKIQIETVRFSPGGGKNSEACECLVR